MNWTMMVALVILAVVLLVFAKSIKETFIDTPKQSAMYEQWLFGNNNYLFNRDVVDKGIPVNDGIDVTSSFNKAVSNPDVDLPDSPDRDFTTLFTKDPTAKYKALDAYCKTISRPIDFKARGDSPVACGWWFVSEPTIPSVPAAGTANAPLFRDSLPGSGYWVWETEQAQMLEELKECHRVKTCSSIELDNFHGKCGWCDHKGYSVPIEGGVEKYPKSSAACGEKLIVDGGECDIVKPPTISASDGTLCGIYGTPSADNMRREYTPDECSSMLGKYTSDGSCISHSGLILNDECRGLNKPIGVSTLPIVKQKPGINSGVKNTGFAPTTNSLLPLSQLGLFGGAVTMTDESAYLPGQSINDVCTLNQYGKLSTACIISLATNLGFTNDGAILRILNHPGASFNSSEEMAMTVLISDGLLVPGGGLYNMTDKKQAGNFLNKIYDTMLTGKSGLLKAAATVLVNGDTSRFDPCNPANPPIESTGKNLSTSPLCLQRMFRQSGCQASGLAYPLEKNSSLYSSQSLATIQQTFDSLYKNMSSPVPSVQDEAVKNCLGVAYSRNSSIASEYKEIPGAMAGINPISCYDETPEHCQKLCSNDPTCLSYQYNNNGKHCIRSP